MFYMIQMLLGLEYLHLEKVLHRDLKPENTLVLANGYVKLTDLGLSEKFGPEAHMISKRRSGTRPYMAPEAFTKTGRHGRGFDHFALGVTLHEMITGVRPYSRHSNKNMKRASTARLIAEEGGFGDPIKVFGSKTIAANIDEDAKDLVKSLLAPNPSKRIGSKSGIAEILAHPWFDQSE